LRQPFFTEQYSTWSTGILLQRRIFSAARSNIVRSKHMRFGIAGLRQVLHGASAANALQTA
jgi:hypothetical protein